MSDGGGDLRSLEDLGIKIQAITTSELDQYAGIPVVFDAERILAVELVENGLGGMRLTEEPVELFRKDYDLYGSPLDWGQEFSLSSWGLFLAICDGRPLGGTAVAWNTNQVDLLEGRRDLSVLWDIRVKPEMRGMGIGMHLFRAAVEWSRDRGCRQMKIETQNTNVAACHFYQRMGARLGDILRFAYIQEPSLAHEVQLNWYLDI